MNERNSYWQWFHPIIRSIPLSAGVITINANVFICEIKCRFDKYQRQLIITYIRWSLEIRGVLILINQRTVAINAVNNKEKGKHHVQCNALYVGNIFFVLSYLYRFLLLFFLSLLTIDLMELYLLSMKTMPNFIFNYFTIDGLITINFPLDFLKISHDSCLVWWDEAYWGNSVYYTLLTMSCVIMLVRWVRTGTYAMLTNKPVRWNQR